MPKLSERNYQFDNAKAALISLVVIGHIFELTVSRKTDIAYTFIYLFHMPLFVFCSGYFAKYSPKRLLKLLILYASFQFLYSVFAILVMGYENFAIQFTTPFWIMWYLFALVVWTSLVPVLDILTRKKSTMLLTMILSVLLGVAAGFESSLGYYLSLGRILYFFPYFVAGYCAKKLLPGSEFSEFTSKWNVRIISGVATTAIAVFVYFYFERVDPRWLWAAQSYDALAYTGYTFYIRILKYVCAFAISLFFMSMMPKKKLFFTYTGTRTLEVFLIHGFVIRLFAGFSVMRAIPGGYVTMVFILLATVAMVFVFSSGVFTPTVWFNVFTGKQVPSETIFSLFRNSFCKFVFGGRSDGRRRTSETKY